MNLIHLAFLFVLNANGNVVGITEYVSLTNDTAACRADIDKDARIATAHGTPTVGRCMTFGNADHAAMGLEGMAKLYDCVRDVDAGRFECSGVSTVVGK